MITMGPMPFLGVRREAVFVLRFRVTLDHFQRVRRYQILVGVRCRFYRRQFVSLAHLVLVLENIELRENEAKVKGRRGCP